MLLLSSLIFHRLCLVMTEDVLERVAWQACLVDVMEHARYRISRLVRLGLFKFVGSYVRNLSHNLHLLYCLKLTTRNKSLHNVTRLVGLTCLRGNLLKLLW